MSQSITISSLSPSNLVAQALDIKKLYEATQAFAEVMFAELVNQQKNEKVGWDDPCWIDDEWEESFQEHISKGNPVDIANLCMFKWYNENMEHEE